MNPWYQNLVVGCGREHDRQCVERSGCHVRSEHIDRVYVPQVLRERVDELLAERSELASKLAAEHIRRILDAVPAGSAERADGAERKEITPEWLTEHDRYIQEQAWVEGYSHCFDGESGGEGVSLADNPYRASVAALDETAPSGASAMEAGYQAVYDSGVMTKDVQRNTLTWRAVSVALDAALAAPPVVDAATNEIGMD